MEHFIIIYTPSKLRPRTYCMEKLFISLSGAQERAKILAAAFDCRVSIYALDLHKPVWKTDLLKGPFP